MRVQTCAQHIDGYWGYVTADGPPNDNAAGMERIVTCGSEDSLWLIEGGIDAFLFTDEADVPYQTQGSEPRRGLGEGVSPFREAALARLREEVG